MAGDVWLKTTRHFDDNKIKRPYVTVPLCEAVVRNPEKSEPQPDGRIRYWAWVPQDGHYWRVVVERDGQTLHTAFRDRNYKGAGKP